ncbi:unnamed protein product [Rotaria sordida]|uniref:Uncharacterized protein n=1 Tax=Rotaria sordida TaxID=392033 RepID=A0A818VQR4_9BILA|nr:unnamed protein product [Rotaria sordida]
MSLESTVNEDDDIQSLSSSTNSDDNISDFHCLTHRTCSRYASCNKKKHQYSSIDSMNSRSLSNNSKPIKGDIRYIDNDPERRQKYDGMRWRRICCMPHCLVFLNGGIYFDNWLCRKHYLLAIETGMSDELDNTTIQERRQILSLNQKLQRTSTRQSNKNLKYHKRGDIIVDANGIRQKYDGLSWRPVCNLNNCNSFMVVRGYCHRHDVENRKKKSELLFSLDNTQQQNSTSQTEITRPIVSTRKKPRKGEIRLVRQQWNGTKWYSLCHYYTRECKRRSAGIKSAYLCDKHYQEYKKKHKDPNLIYNDNDNDNDNDHILLSPTIKRKKSTHNDSIFLVNTIDESNTTISSQSIPTIDRRPPVEQYIQTDVTYPIDSIDLRQGCILIEDDNNDQYQCDSPQYMAYIKKEEEDYQTNKRRLAIDINSLPFNCKLELTKLEI